MSTTRTKSEEIGPCCFPKFETRLAASLVVVREGSEAYAVKGAASVYELAREAARNGVGLAARIRELGLGEAVDLEAAYDEGRVLLPITHPDPAHMHVTGTGLTHLGSASTRDAMHAEAAAASTRRKT